MFSNFRNKRIEKAIAKWQKDKPFLVAKRDLKQEKKEVKDKYKNQKRELTTSKRLMIFLFFSCSVIQIFTLAVTLYSMYQGVYDFTALQMLITAVVGEVIAFAVYSLKSLKENTQGGIVYDTAMWENKFKEKLFQNDEEQEQEIKG